MTTVTHSADEYYQQVSGDVTLSHSRMDGGEMPDLHDICLVELIA